MVLPLGVETWGGAAPIFAWTAVVMFRSTALAASITISIPFLGPPSPPLSDPPYEST